MVRILRSSGRQACVIVIGLAWIVLCWSCSSQDPDDAQLASYVRSRYEKVSDVPEHVTLQETGAQGEALALDHISIRLPKEAKDNSAAWEISEDIPAGVALVKIEGNAVKIVIQSPRTDPFLREAGAGMRLSKVLNSSKGRDVEDYSEYDLAKRLLHTVPRGSRDGQHDQKYSAEEKALLRAKIRFLPTSPIKVWELQSRGFKAFVAQAGEGQWFFIWVFSPQGEFEGCIIVVNETPMDIGAAWFKKVLASIRLRAVE